MPRKKKIPKPATTYVVYNHKDSKPMLVDPEKGTCIEVPMDLPEGVEALKGPNGYYRQEVRNECRRLFFAGVSIPDIAKRTGVSAHSIENWAYSTHNPDNKKKCWKVAKDKWIASVEEENKNKYVHIETGALNKIDEYVKGAKITTLDDFHKFTQGLEKLLKTSGKGREQKDKGQKGVNVNIFNDVAPLSPTEVARQIENDPVRRIANATSKADVSKVLEDAIIVEKPQKD